MKCLIISDTTTHSKYWYYKYVQLLGGRKHTFAPPHFSYWGWGRRPSSPPPAFYASDAGLSESFEVKVGLHQGSVLSPLLFSAVMDVVSSEARSGLPSELLYADDQVIMAPTMEELDRRVLIGELACLAKD